ncbi:MAG: hypothetical protein ACTMIR_02605 [Cellulomonadaceae bacterium]
MGTLRHPAGPLPARVYWVRRLLVLGVVLAVLVAVIALVGRLGADAAPGAADGATPSAQGDGAGGDAAGGDATEGEAAEGEADAAATAEGEATEGDGDGTADEAAETQAAGVPRECTAADMAVSLVSDASTYPAGQNPVFTVEVRAVGDEPCLVDVSDAARALVIVSGSAHVWSSAECREVAARTVLLAPEQVDAQTISWDRTRTDGQCERELPVATAGTYRASVELLGARTDELVLVLQ